jgi:hypothetical protein
VAAKRLAADQSLFLRKGLAQGFSPLEHSPVFENQCNGNGEKWPAKRRRNIIALECGGYGEAEGDGRVDMAQAATESSPVSSGVGD